ncbi:MAG: AAA family ATPase [Planctomycetota bacterium]
MKITDLQVDGFGVWKGLTVESLSDDLTVFCGYNEAGKTTLMQFVRAMMFGFSQERLEKYTPPVYGGLAGGSMDIVTTAGNFEVQRYVDPNRHSDPIGDLAVTNAHDGSVHGRAHLSSLMSDIDESIFVNVFAIGLREIQELGALNSTAAAEQLYKLTSGLDRVSLIDVMHHLKGRRQKIWSSDPKIESRLGVLSDRRQKLLREVDELKQRSKRWSQVAAETTEINNQLLDIEKDLVAKDRGARLIEIAMQISDRWNSRKTVEGQIEAIGRLPDRRDISIEALEDFDQRIAQQKERIEQIKIQRKTIKAEAMGLPINRILWKQKSRIEAVTEHMPWVESLQRQTDRLDSEIERIEANLVGEVDGLGHQIKLKASDIRELGNRGLATLEQSGKKLQAETDRLTKFQNEMEKVEFDLGQHQDRLGTSVAEQSTSESLEDTGRYVNRLRRRIELEEKIDKLNRQRQELERDVDSIVNEQVLTVEKLSVIGVVFIIGVILLGWGLVADVWWETTSNLGILYIFMGLIAGLLSMALKYHWERAAKEEMDDFRHQIEIVRQQLKRAKTERDEIERQLPATVIGQWEIELQDAENRLMRLEELVPLENRVQSTRGVQEEIRRRITAQEREVKKAEDQWQSSLRTTGLPEALRPHQLQEITQRSERVSTFFMKLDQLESEKNSRQKELTALNQRIDLLLHETGVEFVSENLVERLNQLHRSINEQRQFVSARKELAEKYKSLRTRLNKATREQDKLLGQRQRLLAVVGAESEQEYRELDAKHARRRKLEKNKAGLTEQIQAALGKHYTEKQLTQLLEDYGAAGLEKQWTFTQEEIERVKAIQSNLLQQRGEFVQEVKSLGEDSRLDVVQLELNAVNAEIEKLQKDWQVLAGTTQMLEMIRETYESKRQPETLKEASGYLDRLTEGSYTRIWTRLVGEELLVDNANDETIPVDKLSRGTREAVFLSLRLALVGAYARRGAVIPMVLDDVLVNFDGQRTSAAADVLHDFARNGHQILMFTCHDHIRDTFHTMGADVRTLPSHRDVVDSGAVPSTFAGHDLARPVVYRQPDGEVESPDLEPVAEPVGYRGIPVEYVEYASTNVQLEPDDYDAELEYELSAVSSDQRAEDRLRHELVYISPNLPAPLDLSGNEDIWWENSRPVGH